MNEEFRWLGVEGIGELLRKYSEERLRGVVRWLDEDGTADAKVKAKVRLALDAELNRRAAEYYEEKNRGEWI